MKKISFSPANPGFSIALKNRVNEYFKSNGIPFTGNSKLYVKTAILLSSLVLLYVAILAFPVPAWATYILYALMGINFAGIGFNVMHDGAHGSYSGRPWVNTLTGYTLNMLGGSVFLWKEKHNVNHHAYTNIEGHDEDIDIRPWIRTNSNQPRKWFHRFQHIYWVPLYSLTYIAWVFMMDFKHYFKGKIGERKFRKMTTREHIIFWGGKLVYVGLFILIPALVFGWTQAILGFILMAVVCGFLLAVIFQLAHLVEDTAFPMPDASTGKLEEDWMIHQLATTANFSMGSKVINWFAGGLNFQVEHHLFPRISHVHYPELSRLVRETCEQFQVPYIAYPTLVSALGSHVSHLRKTGREN